MTGLNPNVIGDLIIDDGYWYLGSPYSKYPAGMDKAYEDICVISAVLLRAGVRIFSPIAHSHSIAHEGGINPMDHEIWMWADKGLMQGAHGLIVAKMESWKHSIGLMEEIDFFEKEQRPVYMLDLSDLGL